MTDRHDDAASGAPLDGLIGEYLDRLTRGQELDPLRILAEHPEHGQEILDALGEFVDLGREPAGDELLGSIGDYTLRRQIGRGGMGVVYEAWQSSMDRRVALKVLPRAIAADTRAVARFVQEAQLAGKLTHPNIVHVHAMGVEEQVPYYAMELVEGETLAQVVTRLKETAPEAMTPFGPKDGIDYFGRLARAFADVADGLHHAHAKKVIHRDIKPSNLILDAEGHLRILDFGLARLEGQESLTISGDVVGTPQYMSPEQARRKKVPVDHRTDVYSLGATLYEVLTLAPPFRGKDHQDTLSQIIERDPTPPQRLNASVPRDLETIVLKCLRKEAGERYGTAEALGQDLRRFVRGDAVEAQPRSGLEKGAAILRRHALRLGVGAVIAVLLLAVGILALRARAQERLANEAHLERAVETAVDLLQLARFEGPGQQGKVARLQDRLSVLKEGRDTPEGRILVEKLEEALVELGNVGKLLPHRPEPWYYRSRLLAALGRAGEAGRELERVRALDAAFPPTSEPGPAATSGSGGRSWPELWREARSAAGRGEWQAAATAYSALHESRRAVAAPFAGADFDVLLGRGIARLESGDAIGALRDFQTAHGRWPGAAAPIVLTGVAYLGQSDRTDCSVAEAWYREVLPGLEGTPLAGLVILQMAGALKEHGCHPGALRCLERMPLGFLRERARMEVLTYLGRRQEAAAAGEAALAQNPEDGISLALYAGVLSGLPGRARDAEAAIEEAVRLAPEHAEVLRLAAEAHAVLCQWPQAAAKAGRAYELEPSSHAALSTLLDCLLWLERYDDAERLLGDIERDDPRQPFALHMRGFLRTRFGEYEEAIELYRESIRRTPEEGNQSHVRLAMLLRVQGKEKEAEGVYRAAMAAFPGNLTAQWMCGQVLQDHGRNDEALKLYAQSIPRRFEPPAFTVARLADLLRLNPVIRDRTPIDTFIDAYESRGDTEDLPPAALQALSLAWLRSPTKVDPDRALRYATMAVERSGRWEAACLATLATIHHERGDTPGAVETLEEASGLPTFSARHAEMLRSFRAELHPRVVSLDSAEAFIAERREVGDLGLTSWRSERQIGNPGPIPGYVQARRLQLADSFEQAGIGFQSLAQQYGSEPLLLLRAAECLEAAGNPREAERLLASALQPMFSTLASRRQRISEVLGLQSLPDVFDWIAGNVQEHDLKVADSLARTTQLGRAQDFLNWKAAGQQGQWDPVWLAWWRLFATRCGTVEACLEHLPFRTGELGRSPVCLAETFEPLLRRLQRGEEILIDAGARPTTGSSASWESDFAFVFGGPSGTGMGSPSGAILPYSGDIHGTGDDLVYRTLRTFTPGRANGYRIPVPPGRYLLTVHFCELMTKLEGARRLTVEAEGESVVSSFEPLAQGFATASQTSREVAVTDGWLEVALKPLQGEPQVAALEVHRLNE